MYDNGLLKYYKNRVSKQGFLKTNGLPFRFDRGKEHIYCMDYMFTPEGKYFGKSDDKRVMDAEILLSQFFKTGQIHSCIYTPVLDHLNHRRVFCDDVSSPTTMFGGSFFGKIRQQEKTPLKQTFFPFYSFQTPIDYKQYFTKDAIRDYLKMRLFDTAVLNNDRHGTNFFVEVNSQGQATSLRTFDYGASGFVTPEDIPYLDVINDLGDNYAKSQEEMLMQFRENENVLQYLPKNESAEILGNIDAQKISKDIKQTVGYEVSQEFTDMIASSCEHMANELAK